MEGASLQPDAVSVDAEGVAAVSLAAGGLPTEPDQRALMQAQLEASLRGARVRTVEVSADGVPLGADAAKLERGQDGGGALEAISGGTLVALNQGDLEPVESVASLNGLGASHPARSWTGALRVMLSGSDELVTVPTTDADSTVLVTGEDLVAPSVDRSGWAWTAESAGQGEVLAASAGGTVVEVGADWLAGRTVRSLRVARDATRIAVVSDGSDGVQVDVAAVVRDESGTPQGLGEPLRVGTTLTDALQVVWVDESTLGVLGRSGSTTTDVYHLVSVGGPVQLRPARADTVGIAGGKGDSALYVVTDEGDLYARSGSSWALIADDVLDPSFPG